MPDDTSDRRGSSEITGFYGFQKIDRKIEQFINWITDWKLMSHLVHIIQSNSVVQQQES